MTQSIPPQDFALIESIVNLLPPKAQEDARSLFQGWSKQITTLNGVSGVTSGGNNQNVAAPPQGSISVVGSNGAFNVTIVPAQLPQPATLYHRVSYSSVKGFTSNVTTLEPTTSTNMVVNVPNQNLFFRLESSLNKQVWNQPVLASQSSISSGLVSSAAISDGGAFNQTNLGVVTSAAVGATALVEIQGAGGPLTSMVTLKGGQQGILPAATIIGVTPGSSQFVGRKGSTYILKPTLGALLDDGITPIGKVSVVGTGTPTLPVIDPIISGGQIIGYNVVNGGSGASAPYTLTYGSVGGGVGATFGAQTIVAGVLISVAPGNPGSSYSGGTTVTASGGVFPGTQGGGTAEAGNGGRLTAV